MKVTNVHLILTNDEAVEVFSVLATHLNDPDNYAPGSGSTHAQGRAAQRATAKLSAAMRAARSV